MDAKTNVIYRAKHLDVSNLTQSQAASEHLSKAILGSEDISAGPFIETETLLTTYATSLDNNTSKLCLKLRVNCVYYAEIFSTY